MVELWQKNHPTPVCGSWLCWKCFSECLQILNENQPFQPSSGTMQPLHEGVAVTVPQESYFIIGDVIDRIVLNSVFSYNFPLD